MCVYMEVVSVGRKKERGKKRGFMNFVGGGASLLCCVSFSFVFFRLAGVWYGTVGTNSRLSWSCNKKYIYNLTGGTFIYIYWPCYYFNHLLLRSWLDKVFLGGLVNIG